MITRTLCCALGLYHTNAALHVMLFIEFGRGQDIKKLIPPSVLARAHGIMFIRLYRVGFLVSAKGGTGVIIAR